MTTAMKEPPKAEKTEAKKPVMAKTIFRGLIALDKIDVVSNVRKKFDEFAIKELAANIKQLGRVINPITLRPGKAGRYELVAGERRTRASRLAGLTEVDAQVLELTDQQALEYQAAENIHRQDLTPLEEARTFKALLDAGRYTVESLSQLVDKNKVYVYRSISLLELPKEIIDAIDAGDLTPAHGLQILRLPKENRAKVVKSALTPKSSTFQDPTTYDERSFKVGYKTAKELEVEIDEEIGLKLSKGTFPKDVQYAGENACAVCPFNAANQSMLFTGATEGRCMKKTCFDKKTEQVYLDLQAEGKRTWPQLEFVGRGQQDINHDRSGLPGNAIITESEHDHAIIKKLLAERPNKLGYAVILPAENGHWAKEKVWKKARLVMVVRDPALIGGVRTDKLVDCTKPKREKTDSSSPSSKASSSADSSTPKPNPKKEFIDEQMDLSVGRAAIAYAAQNPKAAWRAMTKDAYSAYSFPEAYAAELGVKNDAEFEKKLDDKAIKETDLAKIAVAVLVAEEVGDVPKLFGLNVDAIRQKAKLEAGKAWDKKQADDQKPAPVSKKK